jgi:hypothetical protein
VFPRVFPRLAVGLAKCGFLAFLLALDIHAGKKAWRATATSPTSDPRSQVALGNAPSAIVDSPSSLPNSCELIATEALRRMERAHVWCRILIIRYGDKHEAHALCVFQPHWQICVYDDTGTVELDTNSHDPNAIANLLAIRLRRPIESARFLR